MEMVLSERELKEIYQLCERAELEQLVALSGLIGQMVEFRVKEANDGLALLIDKFSKDEVSK